MNQPSGAVSVARYEKAPPYQQDTSGAGIFKLLDSSKTAKKRKYSQLLAITRKNDND